MAFWEDFLNALAGSTAASMETAGRRRLVREQGKQDRETIEADKKSKIALIDADREAKLAISRAMTDDAIRELGAKGDVESQMLMLQYGLQRDEIINKESEARKTAILKGEVEKGVITTQGREQRATDASRNQGLMALEALTGKNRMELETLTGKNAFDLEALKGTNLLNLQKEENANPYYSGQGAESSANADVTRYLLELAKAGKIPIETLAPGGKGTKGTAGTTGTEGAGTDTQSIVGAIVKGVAEGNIAPEDIDPAFTGLQTIAMMTQQGGPAAVGTGVGSATGAMGLPGPDAIDGLLAASGEASDAATAAKQAVAARVQAEGAPLGDRWSYIWGDPESDPAAAAKAAENVAQVRAATAADNLRAQQDFLSNALTLNEMGTIGGMRKALGSYAAPSDMPSGTVELGPALMQRNIEKVKGIKERLKGQNWQYYHPGEPLPVPGYLESTRDLLESLPGGATTNPVLEEMIRLKTGAVR